MDIKQFTRRLRREVKANPKKAAILGLLCVVALYYWAPLVWGWVGGRKSAELAEPGAAATTDQAPRPAAFAPLAGAAAAAESGKPGQPADPSRPWQQVVQWIEQDPTMKPFAARSQRRDPFHPAASEVAANEEEEPDEAQTAETAKDLTPDALGAQLTSTLIGPQRRVAVINGRPCQEGRTIAMAKDGQQVEFKLCEVHPRRVVLERDGKRYELAIPPSAPSGRLEMSGGTY